MMLQPFLALPARMLVPLLFAVTALFVIGLNYRLEVDDFSSYVYHFEQQRLRERLGIEQTRLEELVGQGNLSQVRRLVSGMALHSGVRQAWLVNDQGVVIGSLSRTDLNFSLDKLFSTLPGALNTGFRQVLTSQQPDIRVRVVESEQALIGAVLVYPRHHLLVWLDLNPALTERMQLGLHHLLLQAGVTVVIALFVGLLLHLLWFKRAKQLTEVATQLRSGDLQVRAQLSGRDELATISTALDRMAEHQQRYQEQLRQTLRHLETLANASPVLFRTSGLDKGCTWFNQRWLDFTGRSMAQEQGNGWAEGVHPDDFEYCLNVYRKAFDTRQPFSMEYRLCRKDGTFRWLLDQGLPRYDADGRFLGYIGSCMDIHDTKQLQEQLISSEAHYRYLFQQNPAPMLIYERTQLHILSVNDAFLHHYGYSPETVLQLKLPDLYPEYERQAITGLARRLLGHNEVGEWHHLKQNGELIDILVYSHDLNYQALPCRVAVISDITERKQAETALQLRNRELEQFNAASVGRELAMIELKRQINRLSLELGRKAPYDLSFEQDRQAGTS